MHGGRWSVVGDPSKVSRAKVRAPAVQLISAGVRVRARKCCDPLGRSCAFLKRSRETTNTRGATRGQREALNRRSVSILNLVIETANREFQTRRFKTSRRPSALTNYFADVPKIFLLSILCFSLFHPHLPNLPLAESVQGVLKEKLVRGYHR